MWNSVCVCVLEGNRWGCNGAIWSFVLVFLHPSMPSKGTLGGWGGFGWLSGSCHGFTSCGNALCHPPSLHHLQPLHFFIPGYTITAHKGLSSQVQPRLARIKKRFQHKMFFPHFFKQLLPSSFLFSFFFSCHPFFFPFSCTCCTLFTHFFHFLPNKSCSLLN